MATFIYLVCFHNERKCFLQLSTRNINSGCTVFTSLSLQELHVSQGIFQNGIQAFLSGTSKAIFSCKMLKGLSLEKLSSQKLSPEIGSSDRDCHTSSRRNKSCIDRRSDHKEVPRMDCNFFCPSSDFYSNISQTNSKYMIVTRQC